MTAISKNKSGSVQIDLLTGHDRIKLKIKAFEPAQQPAPSLLRKAPQYAGKMLKTVAKEIYANKIPLAGGALALSMLTRNDLNAVPPMFATAFSMSCESNALLFVTNLVKDYFKSKALRDEEKSGGQSEETEKTDLALKVASTIGLTGAITSAACGMINSAIKQSNDPRLYIAPATFMALGGVRLSALHNLLSQKIKKPLIVGALAGAVTGGALLRSVLAETNDPILSGVAVAVPLAAGLEILDTLKPEAIKKMQSVKSYFMQEDHELSSEFSFSHNPLYEENTNKKELSAIDGLPV